MIRQRPKPHRNQVFDEFGYDPKVGSTRDASIEMVVKFDQHFPALSPGKRWYCANASQRKKIAAWLEVLWNQYIWGLQEMYNDGESLEEILVAVIAEAGWAADINQGI